MIHEYNCSLWEYEEADSRAFAKAAARMRFAIGQLT